MLAPDLLIKYVDDTCAELLNLRCSELWNPTRTRSITCKLPDVYGWVEFSDLDMETQRKDASPGELVCSRACVRA